MKKSHVLLIALLALVLFPACLEKRQYSLIRQADQLVSKGKFSSAEEVLRKTVMVDPDSRVGIRAVFKLGFVQEVYLKDIKGALLNYDAFVKRSTDPIRIYEVRKRIARLYFDQLDQPESAKEVYEELIKTNSNSLEIDYIYFQLAQCYFRMNEFEVSRSKFQELIDRFPESQWRSRAQYEIGNSYYMEDNYRLSVTALKQVIRTYPQSRFVTDSKYLMAQSHVQLGNYEEALRLFVELKGQYPTPKVVDEKIKKLRRRVAKLRRKK